MLEKMKHMWHTEMITAAGKMGGGAQKGVKTVKTLVTIVTLAVWSVRQPELREQSGNPLSVTHRPWERIKQLSRGDLMMS